MCNVIIKIAVMDWIIGDPENSDARRLTAPRNQVPVPMDDKVGSDRIPLQLIRGCLVASIQIDLTDRVLSRFRQDLLARIGSTHVHGVILDVSGVEVMDSVDFEMLKTTMTMASVMGASPVIVGLKPGIVSALVDMDVDTRGVRAALNLDDALHMLSATDTDRVVSMSETEGEMDATGR